MVLAEASNRAVGTVDYVKERLACRPYLEAKRVRRVGQTDDLIELSAGSQRALVHRAEDFGVILHRLVHGVVLDQRGDSGQRQEVLLPITDV